MWCNLYLLVMVVMFYIIELEWSIYFFAFYYWILTQIYMLIVVYYVWAWKDCYVFVTFCFNRYDIGILLWHIRYMVYYVLKFIIWLLYLYLNNLILYFVMNRKATNNLDIDTSVVCSLLKYCLRNVECIIFLMGI